MEGKLGCTDNVWFKGFEGVIQLTTAIITVAYKWIDGLIVLYCTLAQHCITALLCI